MAPVEPLARIDRLVEQPGLGLVALGDRCEPAGLPDPPRDQGDDGDREHRRRVVQRAGADVGPVVEDRGEAVGDLVEDVVADQDDRDPRRADVLLRPRVHERVPPQVQGAGEQVAGHVADEMSRLGDRRIRWPLDPLDRLVRGRVDERRAAGRIQLVGTGHVVVAGPPAVPGRASGSDARPLGQRLGRPRPGHDVGTPGPLAVQQVHRCHRELQAGSSLQEQHVEAVGDRQQLSDPRLRFLQDLGEPRGAVTHLEDRSSRGVGVAHERRRALEHGAGQRGGSRREVPGPFAHRIGSSLDPGAASCAAPCPPITSPVRGTSEHDGPRERRTTPDSVPDPR